MSTFNIYPSNNYMEKIKKIGDLEKKIKEIQQNFQVKKYLPRTKFNKKTKTKWN